MHVVAVHSISDPEGFFSSVEKGMSDIPAGIRVHSLAPSPDGARAVCLWEGDSLDSIRSVVEGAVGDSSQNEYYEVDSARAIGLPA